MVGLVGLGQKNRGLGWVLKIGPTAMSELNTVDSAAFCVFQLNDLPLS